MAKKSIRVHTPFHFTHADGTKQHFDYGHHTVEQSVAEHWFVVAHAEVTGNAKNDFDATEFQAQIASLTTQLEEKDKTLGELQAAGVEKDAQIARLTTQLAELQKSVPATEATTDGKKPKSSDGK